MQLKIPGETALISLAVHEFADIFVIFVNKFSGRTHEPQVVQDVENLYAGIFLKNRLRYRVAQN